jgi:hypothetical protein
MKRQISVPQDFTGLNVKERLCIAGLVERFDAAARQGNRATMMAMLKRVSLPKAYATQWVDTLLGDDTFFYR